jgi:transcriptional regulator with XRE-family HTH domain
MNGVGERLKILRESYGLRQEDLAERLSIKQGYLSYVESGKRTLSSKLMEKVMHLFPVNKVWLLYGSGEMLTKPLATNELPPSKGLSDFKVLKAIITTVKECIAARKIRIEPAEEAGLIIVFYKFFYESESDISAEQIKERILLNFDFAVNVSKQIPFK